MSGVISEAHVPGNDGFKLYSVVCGRRSPAGLALRRVLRQAEEPPLRPENFFALLREITYNKSCGKRGTCLVKTHCFRLRRGADLLSSLEDYAKTQHLKAASVVCAVGCVSAAVVRDASGVNIRALCEPLEIVSLMGTLSEARTHLHISFSREDLSTVGGHLREGCIVNTTAEIVLLELDGVCFDAEYDEDTGYDELVILEDTP